jgi:hypothetical protein
MHAFEVQRQIAASPEAIWAVLTDARQLESGAFGITRLEGDIVPGGTLKLWSTVAPQRGFPLQVTAMEPYRQMTWRGGMPLGLFRGVRTFSLTRRGAATRFVMREDYSGLLEGLIWPSMPDLNPSFEIFATALAALTERIAP